MPPFLCTLSLIYDEIHIKKLFIFPICPKKRINIYTISDMHIECQNLLLISRGCFFIGFLPEKKFDASVRNPDFKNCYS